MLCLEHANVDAAGSRQPTAAGKSNDRALKGLAAAPGTGDLGAGCSRQRNAAGGSNGLALGVRGSPGAGNFDRVGGR